MPIEMGNVVSALQLFLSEKFESPKVEAQGSIFHICVGGENAYMNSVKEYFKKAGINGSFEVSETGSKQNIKFFPAQHPQDMLKLITEYSIKEANVKREKWEELASKSDIQIQ